MDSFRLISFARLLFQVLFPAGISHHLCDTSMTCIDTPEKPRALVAFLLALAIFSLYALLARQAELRLAVPLLVGVTAAVTILLACAFCLGKRGSVSWSPLVILIVALLLRLMFLFAPPQLSDDIYRYLWDGSTTLSGNNPYAAAPSAVTPPSGLSEIHSRINHPKYVTIYPPAAQVVFAGGAAFGGTITGLKTLLVLLDMGLCALLVALLKRLEMPVWRAVLYAWNPLPVLEIAGSGHVDGAGLTMLMGALCLLVAGQGTVVKRWPFLLSGALLAAAGLVKLFPFVLAPLLFLLVPKGRRSRFVAGFAASLAVLIVPFLPHVTNMFTSLDVYARTWEFAGFAFTSLRSLTGSGTAARLILSTAFLFAVAAILRRFARNSNSSASPTTQACQTLNACYATAMALLLLTPTLQPWYALCLAAFLPFSAGPAGLILCWAVFLTYQVQIPYFILGQWHENPLVTVAVFVAPVTAWGLARLFGQWWGAGGKKQPYTA